MAYPVPVTNNAMYFSLYAKPSTSPYPTLFAGTDLTGTSPKQIVPNNIIKLKSADC